MVFRCILQYFVAIVFCDLRCFVAKSVLVQFTHFCVEKNLAKNWARGEGWKVRITTCPEHEASL